jgi:Fur family ferric uptake transcriptional regulator
VYAATFAQNSGMCSNLLQFIRNCKSARGKGNRAKRQKGKRFMYEQERLVSRLRARNIRVTPQRAMILRAIESMPGHLTAEEVYRAVQAESPYVNLATVYRTLDLLKSLDLITDADMGTGATHYALRSHADHHHAICRACRHSVEFPDHLLDSLVSHLYSDYHFQAEANHVVVFGLCTHCAEQEAASLEGS